MASSEIPSVSTGDLWTAANHNTYLRDNFIDHETRIVTAESDINGLQAHGMFLISEQILSDVAAAITFSSIPQTYRNLKLVYNGRFSIGATYNTGRITLNSDAGNNYDSQVIYATNAAITTGDVFGIGYAEIMSLSAANAISGASGAGEILFPNYSGTTFHKVVIGTCSYKMAEGDGGYAIRNVTLFWRSAAAINRFDLTPSSSGNFVAGSIFSLYGII